jgi:hypothetical protein
MNKIDHQTLRTMSFRMYLGAHALGLITLVLIGITSKPDQDGNNWGTLIILIALLYFVPAMVILLVTLLLGRLRNKIGYVSSAVSALGATLVSVAAVCMLIVVIGSLLQ